MGGVSVYELHAQLMLVTWFVAAPLGILLAAAARTLKLRALANGGRPAPVVKGLYLSHKVVFIVVFPALLIAGLAVFGGLHFGAYAHSLLGMAVVVLAAFQWAAGAAFGLLPKPKAGVELEEGASGDNPNKDADIDDTTRKETDQNNKGAAAAGGGDSLLRRCHRVGGYLVWVLAAVTTLSGPAMLEHETGDPDLAEQYQIYVYAGLAGVAALLASIFLYRRGALSTFGLL